MTRRGARPPVCHANASFQPASLSGSRLNRDPNARTAPSILLHRSESGAAVDGSHVIPVSHVTTINAPIFLRLLTASILFWAAIVFCLILLVNPYGVSVVNYSLRNFNAAKPKRIDIDRIIKPFEVAVHKPRTIFMGTSRIHRSIDPLVLDGTPFAPAYNASIPASTLIENANLLADFFGVDQNLKYVFIELYFYNFIHDQSEPAPRDAYWLARTSVSLFFSADAHLASLQTVFANAWGRQGAEIKRTRFFPLRPRLGYSYQVFRKIVYRLDSEHSQEYACPFHSTFGCFGSRAHNRDMQTQQCQSIFLDRSKLPLGRLPTQISGILDYGGRLELASWRHTTTSIASPLTTPPPRRFPVPG